MRAQAVTPRRSRVVNTRKLIARQRENVWRPPAPLPKLGIPLKHWPSLYNPEGFPTPQYMVKDSEAAFHHELA